MRRWLPFLVVCVLASRADAAFHLMMVDEVYGGSPASPSAQYVQLRMYFAGQSIVSGTSIAVYNASNAELGR